MIDLGAATIDDDDDYPEFAGAVAEKVWQGAGASDECAAS